MAWQEFRTNSGARPLGPGKKAFCVYHETLTVGALCEPQHLSLIRWVPPACDKLLSKLRRGLPVVIVGFTGVAARKTRFGVDTADMRDWGEIART